MSLVNKLGLRRRRNSRTRAHPRLAFIDTEVNQASLDKDGIVKLLTSRGPAAYQCRGNENRPFIGRLTFHESMTKSHTAIAATITFEGRVRQQSDDLTFLLAPALQIWTQANRDLQVVELGPSHTTAVPEALAEVIDTYTAVDFSAPFLAKQKEFLNQIPALAGRCNHVVADTFELPLPRESADLIVASCHPPFVSAPTEDCITALRRVHSVLKPGGFFAVFPWSFSEQTPATNRELLNKFRLMRMAFKRGLDNRLLLLLQKI